MRALYRVGLLALLIVLAFATLAACGGGDEQSTVTESTGGQNDDATTDSSTDSSQEDDGTQAETEVSGLPDGFPSDVPVHPGKVTAYDPIEVNDSTTVHQLTVESAASFDDVIAWYNTQLPANWSVGFLEETGDSGSREGKIALNGGSYTPANPGGLGGGVILGVFEGDKTEIVVTVTVMAP